MTNINVRKLSTLFLLLLVGCTFCFLPAIRAEISSNQQVTVTAENAESKIQAAKLAIEQAFNTVLDSERAGANVTDLVEQLNGASQNCAEARNEFINGNYLAAETAADNAAFTASQVNTAAQNIKQSALNSIITRNLFTIAITIFIIVALVLALFLLWKRIKKNYLHDLSNAKPEVNSDES
jgi:hypothetical protein